MKNNKGLQSTAKHRIIAGMLILMLIMSVSACFVAKGIYEEQKVQAVTSELRVCSGTIQSWINEKVNMALFMADEIINRGYDLNRDMCTVFLQDCLARDEQIFDCYIGFNDKTCVFGGDWNPTPEEYDPTSRDWFKSATAADGMIITDPYTDAETGRPVITCAYKLERDGNILGVFAVDIFIDNIAELVNSLKIDNGGYAVLTTEAGEIIVHKNKEYLPSVDSAGNDKMVMLSDVIPDYKQNEALGKIIDGRDFDNSRIKYSEVKISPTDWTLNYILDRDEYQQKMKNVIILFAAMTLAFAVILYIIISVTIKSVFRPLGSIAKKAQQASEGNLDIVFNYNGNDEIGDVCRAIENNNIVMKQYIYDITNCLNDISCGNFNSSSNTSYAGDYASIGFALENISMSLRQIFSNIEISSDAVFDGANGVSDSANNLADFVSKQTELIHNIVADVNKVSTKVNNNVIYTDEARDIAKKTEVVVSDSNSLMEHLLSAINEISKSSEEIQNIIGTIDGIAFQTNILALNASVEAARVGAAGKGFAVVADEVRNLAQKSAEASEKTSKLIAKSVEAVSLGMKYADETSDSLQKVVYQTNEIDDIIEKINKESYEQRTYIDEMSEKIDLVSSYVTSASSNAIESASASENLNNQASALKQMLKNFGV